MKTKPILFSAEKVQAIMNGQKTCKRCVIKDADKILNSPFKQRRPDIRDEHIISQLGRRPYYKGDILYVREPIAWQSCLDCEKHDAQGRCEYEKNRRYHDEKEEHGCYMYRASCRDNEYLSIHMPKEAARLWLRVTDVRVERLQEITEDGAKAEGAIDNRGFIHSPENEYDHVHTARERFSEIWDSTIKKSDLDRYGWDANPWVWLIEFERCEKPECVSDGDLGR